MRNSKRRSPDHPERPHLLNPATPVIVTSCRRLLLRPVLLASIVAMLSGTTTATEKAAKTTSGPASLKQIQALVDRGQVDVAEKQLWEMVVREPENAAAINLLGIIRTRQKRYPEAEALFKRVLVITTDSPSTYRSLGELYQLQERSQDAKAAYSKAHDLDPKDKKASLALGRICQEAGEFERSIEILKS